MRTRMLVALALCVLCLPSNAARSEAASRAFGAPAEDFPLAAKAPQSLYVYNAGTPGLVSGEYARYSLPDLTLQETSVADGVGSPVAFGRSGQPYFVDEASAGFALYAIPAGSGSQPGLELFSGIPCAASSLATGPTGNIYVVQYCNNSVLEYKPKGVRGGGSKNPFAMYTGGNLRPSGPYPSSAVVDKKGDLYIGDTGGGVTYFPKGSTSPTISYPTGKAGSVNQMVADDKGDVWSIHGPNPTEYYFKKGQCVMASGGTVIGAAFEADVRYKLAERFSGGFLVQELYTAAAASPYSGSDGVSIAVDSRLRVYAGVDSSNDSVVLDYDPGESCPNDGLALLGANPQDPQIAVDSGRNFYVTDYVDNTISAYKGGSATLVNSVTQQSGLINMLYAAIK